MRELLDREKQMDDAIAKKRGLWTLNRGNVGGNNKKQSIYSRWGCFKSLFGFCK